MTVFASCSNFVWLHHKFGLLCTFPLEMIEEDIECFFFLFILFFTDLVDIR